MAVQEHVEILKKGVDYWNSWRKANSDLRPDLSGAFLDVSEAASINFANTNLIETKLLGADLRNAFFSGSDLSRADLSDCILKQTYLLGVNLSKANLARADLSSSKLMGANLIRVKLDKANLSEANLSHADLSYAQLHETNLYRADLRDTNFKGANLSGANFQYSILRRTVFANANLSASANLDTCKHKSSSIVDMQTLRQSWPLPIRFLRGCGLDEVFIDYLPSLLSQPLQYYSCFISYSSRDQEFAERLHADLQDKGVRCWFAPEDMKIGADIWDTIDEAIRLRDKVLLILSESSVESTWVEDEVKKAFSEERNRKEKVLFPVRIDDAVMQSAKSWASKIRENRHIGYFCNWKDHDVYQLALARLLRDLKTTTELKEL